MRFQDKAKSLSITQDLDPLLASRVCGDELRARQVLARDGASVVLSMLFELARGS